MGQLTPMTLISMLRRTANSNKGRRRRPPTNSSFSTKFGLSSQIIFSLFYIFITSKMANTIYQREKCEYTSANYSLEWAHEPVTQHVVFVLKARLPERHSQNEYWTGVGFGTAKTELSKHFIGVKTNQKSSEILLINSDEGRLNFNAAKKSSNVHTISTDYDEKSNTVVAKFSRPVESDRSEQNFELKGCMTFNIPKDMISADEIISKNLSKLMKQIEVCDLKSQCTIDVRQLNNTHKTIPLPLTKSKELRNEPTKKFKDVGTKDGVEIAHSVDISGTGDPCGFAAPSYTVNWTYNKKSDCIDFVMRHPVKPGKWWSAVGIGDTMADMDIGVVFLEDGMPKKIIDYYSSSYTVPEKDSHQDWILHTSRSKIVQESLSGSSEKQKIAVTFFSRRISTADTEKDRTMDGCVLFQLAANSARWGGNFALRKHEDWPDLYKACDLKSKCVSEHHIEHSTDGNVENDENVREGMEDFDESVDDNANITSAVDITKSDNLAEETQESNAGKAEPEAETSDDQTAAAILAHNIRDNNSSIPESEEMDEGTISDNNNTVTAVEFNETINGTHESDDDNTPADSTKTTSSPSTILTLTGEFTTSATDVEADHANNSAKIAGTTANDTQASHSVTNDPIAAVLLANNNNETQGTKSIREDKVSKSNRSDSISTSTTTVKATTTSTVLLTTNLKVAEPTKISADPTEIPINNTREIEHIENSTSNVTIGSSPTLAFATTAPTPHTHTTTTVNIIQSDNSTNPTQNTINSTSTGSTTSSSSNPTTKSIITTEKPDLTTTESISKNSVQSLALRPSNNKKIGKPREKCEPSKSDLDICAGYMDNYFSQVKQWADKHSEKMENQYDKACRLLNAVPHVPTLCCNVFQQKCIDHI